LLADATFILDTTRARTVLGWTPRQDNVALTCAAYDWYAQHAHEAAPRRNAVLALLDAFSYALSRARLAPYTALAGAALPANLGRLDYPFKLTFCVPFLCNYRCQTCNIWK